jgi:NADH-quinone oxidoreductase subunit H
MKSPLSALRASAPAGAALAVAWLLGGPGACSQVPAPQLVQVLDVSPREVERGDSFAIAGEGFPAGKAARVTFRGTLSRPGERPVRDAEIVTSGTVVGPERVVVSFGEAAEALFCGAGDLATHTTFEGDVEVAFAAAQRGEPPVGGTLAHVTLDVRPSMRSADVARDADGARLFDWLGAHVASPLDSRAAVGLTIESVSPGSRAESAGLAAGDVITAFDGVRVASAGDAVPPPGEREAAVLVRRPGSADETPRAVSVSGFRRAPIEQLVGPLLVMLAALASIFLFAAPTPSLLAGLLDGVVVRLRSRGDASPGGARSSRSPRAFAEATASALPPAGPSALADAAAGALLALMPFGQYLVASQVDVAVLFLGATTALVTAALLAGRSPLGGIKAALHVVWQHVPGALAVLCVIASTGSVRVQEIARAQGGLPWEWMALRSPPLLSALLLLLACALIEPVEEAPRPGLAALVQDAAEPSTGRRGPWLAAAWRTHRVVLAGLAVALLLGGWRIPGVAPAVQDARPALELAGAAVFLGKTWGLVVVLAWTRTLWPQPSLSARSRRVAVRLVPLALATLGATLAWGWWRPAPAVDLLASGAVAVVFVSILAAVVVRVRYALAYGRGPAADGSGHVSVFL